MGSDYWSYRRRENYRLSRDIKEQRAMSEDPYSKELLDQGELWFNNGFKLESAPEQIRDNKWFKNGYEKAKRISIINDELYNLGVEYAHNNINVMALPKNYSNNPFFMKGFNEFNKRRGK